MTTTTQNLIDEARGLFFGGTEERANRLDGPLDNVSLSMALKYDLAGIQPGTIVAIDLEEIRIWETTGRSATVIERAVNGSSVASHLNLGYVAVQPKFSNFRILRAFNEELQSLSAPVNGLYVMSTLEVSYNPSVAGYDLAGVAALDQVYMVEAKYSGLPHDWMPLAKRMWRVDRQANLSDFPSGFGLFAATGQPGQPLRVWYKAPFTVLSKSDATVDVNTTSGLPATANDLLPLGAAVRLVLPREVKRNFSESQGEPRRAQEVPPGAVTQSATGLIRFRQQRILEEASRLARQYPNRSAA